MKKKKGNFVKMKEECYKCGKVGCARATDNKRQFYCFRHRETYFMNNLKGYGGNVTNYGTVKNTKKEREGSLNHSRIGGLFDPLENTKNHYENEI